ncbi:spore germination protein [Paenibacillus alginolyticus]|uniref:spore germination protein n=1 Tax=Paenibacillus alginolyticus TaxID=59839 RepID=UPI0022837645|nr:spore germination protein [Paenibacillus alginolyticus]
MAFSPFPTIQNTDRLDVVASSLLDGRIAILVDGTPFALIVQTFGMALQSQKIQNMQCVFLGGFTPDSANRYFLVKGNMM